MKLNHPHTQSGSALIMTIFTCVLIGTVLGSYLLLIGNRNSRAMRATAWNSGIAVLEAGIEEALTHLQLDSNNPTGNGWAADSVNGQPVYWKTRSLPDGSYFSVTNFAVATASPYIHSAAYVPSPLKTNQFISRLVEVNATNPPSGFTRAIAAEGPIKLSGNAVVDGFSSAGFSSAMSAYNTPTNRNANGGIATNSRQLKAIDVGTAHVYGTAVTGPGGTVATAGGTVGDFDWSSKNTGIEPGWTNDNMNVQFQSTAPPDPNPAWMLPISNTAGGSNITVCGTGTYRVSSLVSLGKTRPVVITGDCSLWVQGDLSVSGDGYIRIEPQAKLRLYVSGNASISGGGIVNGSGLPQNFTYYGLPSSKVLQYSGVANFIGTINAPKADMTLSGGASVYGAVICKSFNCSGGSSVHYDQSLNGGGMFMVTAWREL